MGTTRLITREQFEQVQPLLDAARKKTRPRKNDLYDVLCAILYRQQTGISWRNLPPEFPAWRSVHEYHIIWTMPARDGGHPVLERVLALLGFDGRSDEAGGTEAVADGQVKWDGEAYNVPAAMVDNFTRAGFAVSVPAEADVTSQATPIGTAG